LQKADVVRLEPSGSSYLVRGIPGKLKEFVEHHWGIRDLKRFAQATPDNRSRESLAEIAGDSKALRNAPLAGIFIRSFGNCFLQGQPLAMTPSGTAIFVSPSQLRGLEVSASTLIAVENPACLLNFEKTSRHFPGQKWMISPSCCAGLGEAPGRIGFGDGRAPCFTFRTTIRLV
jgi:hypothetical protein